METARPFDWEGRYVDENTPWDLGAPHPELAQRLADGRLAPPERGARALVPGCGRGHDALALARSGWDVVAVELVPRVAGELAPALERAGGRVVVGDVLDRSLDHVRGAPYDLVWDHTFFCALALEDRARWGALASELVRPGGRFVSLLFPIDRPPDLGGPPFGMTARDVRAALGDAFEVVEDGPVERPVARRSWREGILVAARAGG